MYRFIFFLFFFWLIFSEILFCQWIDISPKGRKEKIYSVDLKTKDTEVSVDKYQRLTDTILAVGWSSTGGALLLSFDGGKNWSYYQIPTLFPFAGSFWENNQLVVCGYNFLFDHAEVRVYDYFGNQLDLFEFNGENLPYSKNFFDCLLNNGYVYVCGYGGSIFKFDQSSNNWETVPVETNKVLTKLKKFEFNTSQGAVSLGFLLGGENYFSQNSIYYSNPDFTEWNLLVDFSKEYPGIEIADFWFYDWDIELGFPRGFVIGNFDDTLLIFKTTSEKNFEVIYKQQSILQPLGIFVSKTSSETIAIFDDGKILLSPDFGKTWTFIEERIGKQLTGVKFFNYFSYDLMPDIYWVKLNILGFGIDGFIAKFEKEQSLSVEFSKSQTADNCQEIEIYDILGRLVSRFNVNEVNFENWNKNNESGIYLVIKKRNGIVCQTRTYIFLKNFFENLRLF